jgi:hypothetical protein
MTEIQLPVITSCLMTLGFFAPGCLLWNAWSRLFQWDFVNIRELIYGMDGMLSTFVLWLQGKLNIFNFYRIIEVIPGIPNLKALRTLRVLRPLRSINAFPSMRRLISTLIASFPDLANVLVLILFIFILFGIMGVHSFNGETYHRCRLTPLPVNGIWEID